MPTWDKATLINCKTRKAMNRSKLIVKRTIECCENNEIEMGDEMELCKYHFNRLQLVPMADAAKKLGKPFNTIKNWVNDGKLMSMQIGSKVFVSV